MKPGPATSARSTRVPVKSMRSQMTSAILRGGIRNAFAETIAALVAKSPNEGSAGVSMEKAGAGTAGSASSATPRPIAAMMISLICACISCMELVIVFVVPFFGNEQHGHLIDLRLPADLHAGEIVKHAAILAQGVAELLE